MWPTALYVLIAVSAVLFVLFLSFCVIGANADDDQKLYDEKDEDDTRKITREAIEEIRRLCR